MGLTAIIILLFIGSFNALFSSILSFLSQDELKNLHLESPRKAQRLSEIKLYFEESFNIYNLGEIFFYLAASILAGAYFIEETNSRLDVLYAFVILFVAAFFLRTVLYSIGRRYSNLIAPRIVGLLSFITTFSKPFAAAQKFMILKISGRESSEYTREELKALLESSREEGSIDAGEYRIIKNMMQFSEVLVSDVMTPRTVIFSANADKTVDDIIDNSELRMYSRFPIWEGESLDDGVLGYVMSKDVIQAALKGNHERKLREFYREVYFIPENAELDKALDRFLQRRQHLFVVVDEYGGVEGLLTMEDVLETILGVEIVDEADKVVDLREFAKKRRDKRIEAIMKQSEE